MFEKMKNIDSAFRYIRLFTFLIILACLGISGTVIVKSYQLAASTRSTIYILANGKALQAFAADPKDNIPIEAKDHIRTFHQLFFSLDPDDKVIESNLTQALYMADGSAKREYDNLKENGYYSNVIAGNISQQITMDSVTLDVNQYPFYFRYYGTEKIIRTTSIVSRSLVTQGYLRNVSRSDNNSHGFLIERWQTLENKDIKTVNR